MHLSHAHTIAVGSPLPISLATAKKYALGISSGLTRMSGPLCSTTLYSTLGTAAWSCSKTVGFADTVDAT